MKVALVTLCLNEMEFLECNYFQHRDWPGLCNWVIVEGADRAYARANPNSVSEYGLSTDGTSYKMQELAKQDSRVRVVHMGFLDHSNPAQAKATGRNRYMEELESIEPDIVIQIDADEFYPHRYQSAINDLVAEFSEYDCWKLRQRHIWYPPSLHGYRTQLLEVVGGYWGVEHVRIFKWQPGLCQPRDHNHPEVNGQFLSSQYSWRVGDPECVHYGFAKSAGPRISTHKYYVERGEGKERGYNRQMYVDCRAAWEQWEYGDLLPHRAMVIEYEGIIPESMVSFRL